MERLTYRLGEQNPSYGLVDKASAKPGLFTDYDGFYAHLLATYRLGQYEDTGLTPEEICTLKQKFNELLAARDLVDCSVDTIMSENKSLKSEYATLKKALKLACEVIAEESGNSDYQPNVKNHANQVYEHFIKKAQEGQE